MTIEQQIRDFFDANLEHIDLAQDAQIDGLGPPAIGQRPVLVGVACVAAMALVVAGLVAIRTASSGDESASTTPQTAPSPAPTTVSASGTSLPSASSTVPAPTTVGSTIAQVSHLDSAALLDLFDRLSDARSASFRAIDLEVQQCMNEKGFAHVLTPTFLAGGFHPTVDDLVWRFPTDQQAASTGYVRLAAPNVNDVGVPPEGTPEFSALYGNVVGSWVYPDAPAGFGVEGDIYDGCLPAAQTRIIGNGDPKAAFRTNDYNSRLQAVWHPAIRNVTTAPEFIAAQAGWIQCMADAGFDVTDLADPPTRSWTTPRPSPAETAMATTDAACKNSTGLRELGDRLFNEQVTAWFDSHPDDRHEIIDYVTGVIERSAPAGPIPTTAGPPADRGQVHLEEGTYVLAPRDYPSTVAQKFKVTFQDLMTINGWTLVGQEVPEFPPPGTAIRIPPGWTEPDGVTSSTTTN